MGLTVIYFRIGKTVRCIVLFALITRRNTQMSYCSGRLLSNKSLKLGELYTNLNLFSLSPWGNPIKDIMKKSYFDGTLFLFNLSRVLLWWICSRALLKNLRLFYFLLRRNMFYSIAFYYTFLFFFHTKKLKEKKYKRKRERERFAMNWKKLGVVFFPLGFSKLQT